MEEEIVRNVERDQYSSVRQISTNVGVPKSTVQCVIKRQQYYIPTSRTLGTSTFAEYSSAGLY